MLKGVECSLIAWALNTVLLHRLKLIMHPRLALNFGFSCLSLLSRGLQAWDTTSAYTEVVLNYYLPNLQFPSTVFSICGCFKFVNITNHSSYVIVVKFWIPFCNFFVAKFLNQLSHLWRIFLSHLLLYLCRLLHLWYISLWDLLHVLFRLLIFLFITTLIIYSIITLLQSWNQ